MESLKNKKFEILKDSELADTKGGRMVFVRSYGKESGCTANVYQERYLFGLIRTSNTETKWEDD